MINEQELVESFSNKKAVNPELFSELVQRVLYLIAQRLHEQNEEEFYAIAVFTGATAGFREALASLEQLMMSGTEVRIVLSNSAERIYGERIRERLLPWPTASLSTGERWFCELEGAKGVVVPMLSVNTLSKVSGLMADSVATNLILQALFMGKPVVAAIDGCEPGNSDRKKLALDGGTSALQQALGERLLRLNDFGCSLVKSRDLGWFCGRLLDEKNQPPVTPENKVIAPVKLPAATSDGTLSVTMVDAALVRQAVREKKNIKIGSGGVITPLALELAQQQGLQITKY